MYADLNADYLPSFSGRGPRFVQPSYTVVVVGLKSLQRLEDTFDGSTRRNLRHIIVCKDNRSKLRIGDEKLEKTSAQIEHSSDASEEVELEKETYYVLDRRASNTNTDVDVDGDGDVPLKALARIPTCAIFHKMNTGRGVPHAFSSK